MFTDFVCMSPLQTTDMVEKSSEVFLNMLLLKKLDSQWYLLYISTYLQEWIYFKSCESSNAEQDLLLEGVK